MSTSNRTATAAKTVLLLATLAVAGTQQAAQAGSLPEFTGYTRIGWPTDSMAKDDPRVVEALKTTRPMGLTVYFMVLDQRGGDRRGRRRRGGFAPRRAARRAG